MADNARKRALERVTVEHRRDPVGVDTVPRFGWIRNDPDEQVAWQIRLLDGNRVAWDSGKVVGSETYDISYAGPALSELRRYSVLVRSWTSRHLAEGAATFVTGVPAESATWLEAEWIGGPGGGPAPLLRGEIEVPVPPTSAYLVVAAGGHARVEVNGNEVGPNILSPGFTDYDARVQYTVSDITSALRDGRSAVAVELGRGFYGVRSRNEWDWQSASWRSEPCARALVVWDDIDGNRHVAGTNHRWQVAEGPTRSDDLFAGEDYDDRYAQHGWSLPGFDASDWQSARVVDGPGGRLESQGQQSIEVAEEFEPTEARQVDERAWLFTFPRVIAGWVVADLHGDDGEQVEIRLGERLGADGLPDVSDPHGYYAGRFQTHRVTLAGRPLTWEPRFSYQGFRYALVIASRRPRLRARLAHTAVERTGSFRCSSDQLNALHELTVRTVLNNLYGYPTDTPTYEKNGWTGDGMLGAELMLLNLDVHPLLAKWAQDISDSRRGGIVPSVIAPDGGWRVDWTPAPTWHSAFVLVPWWLHRYSGDERLLRQLWPAIQAYVRFELGRSPGGIASTTLADWVAPETSPAGGNPPEDPRISATAFLFAMLAVAASISQTLGEDPGPWLRDAARVRSAFISKFLDRGREIVRGVGDDGFRQTHNVLALAFNLLPASSRLGVAEALVADIRKRDYHLNTGALGTKWLLPVLTQAGHADVALRIAEQRDFPSWGYWLSQGATTLWEHWDARSRSRNHYFLGTLDDWLFHDVAGVRPTAPGWKTFEVAPRLTRDLASAEAEVLTPYGRAGVRWDSSGAGIEICVTVPSGTLATLVWDGSREHLGAGLHRRTLATPSRVGGELRNRADSAYPV